MNVDTNLLVPMTDANQNFSKVTRTVDENGMAVILKNNKPKYIVVDFNEYDQIQELRKKIIESTSDIVIAENLEAFKELAK